MRRQETILVGLAKCWMYKRVLREIKMEIPAGTAMPPRPLLNHPHAKGPIRDHNAARVCNLSGITAAQDQLVTLRQLRNGLETSMRELETQHRRDQRLNSAFLVLRFTKATCDAFIEMAAAFTGEEGEGVKRAYGMVNPVAGSVSAKIAGQSVDAFGTAASVAKSGSSALELGGELTTKSLVVKGEVIRAAMNGDRQEILRTAGKYVWDTHATILKSKELEKGIKELSNTPEGKKLAEKAARSAKGLGILMQVASATHEYHRALGEVFNQASDAQWETDQSYIQMRANILTQARHISAKIAHLERYIQSS